MRASPPTIMCNDCNWLASNEWVFQSVCPLILLPPSIHPSIHPSNHAVMWTRVTLCIGLILVEVLTMFEHEDCLSLVRVPYINEIDLCCHQIAWLIIALIVYLLSLQSKLFHGRPKPIDQSRLYGYFHVKSKCLLIFFRTIFSQVCKANSAF